MSSEEEEFSDESITDYSDGDDDSESMNEMSDNEDNHHKLLDAIEKFAAKSDDHTSSSHKTGKLQQSAMLSSDSAFSSIFAQGGASMEALLGALNNTEHIKQIEQRMTELQSAPGPPKHVDKVVSTRLERGLTYDKNSEEIAKWQDIVAKNKHAKSLDLAEDKRLLPSHRALVKSFEPTTSLEKDVQMVMLKSGMADEEAMQNNEYNALQGSSMTLEEIKQKQAELAKFKALMFYEQMKNHRINKIKSKAYHRIRKRQKLKRAAGQVGSDEEGENSDAEEEAKRRIQERMDLKHKNTGKWAKMALKHSHGDKALRQAYHEAVQLGNELTRKINDDRPHQKAHKTNDFSDEDGDDTQKSVLAQAIDDTRQVLAGCDGPPEVDGKYKKLFDMSFMKRARDSQQERAMDEAKAVLHEIAEMEANDDSDADKPRQKQKSAEELKALEEAKVQVSDMLGDVFKSGKSVVKSTSVKAAATNNPWLDDSAKSERQVTKGNKRSAEPVVSVEDDVPEAPAQVSVAVKKSKTVRSSGATTASSKTVISTSSESVESSRKKHKTEKQASSSATATEPNATTKKQLVAKKTQEELVQAAFAGPDYEADFAQIKQRMVDDELNIDEKKIKALAEVKSGWGDWAGPGAGGPSQKTVAKRKRILQHAEEHAAELRAGRRDAALANVVISDRRIKTASKFKIADIPHPFTSREEYERSLQMPLGEEWNASNVVRKNTKPEIMLRAGRAIDPIKLPKDKSKDDGKVLSGTSGAAALKKKSVKPYRKPL